MIQGAEDALHHVVHVGEVDDGFGAFGHVEAAAVQRGVDERVGRPRPRQSRAVDPGRTQADAFEPVEPVVGVAEVLHGQLADPVRQKRHLVIGLGVDLVHLTPGLLGAEEDHAPDVEEAHGLHDVEAAAHVDLHDLPGIAHGRTRAHRRRQMHDGIGAVRPESLGEVRKAGDVADDGRDIRAAVRQRPQRFGYRDVEGDDPVTARDQPLEERHSREAAGASHEYLHLSSPDRPRRRYNRYTRAAVSW